MTASEKWRHRLDIGSAWKRTFLMFSFCLFWGLDSACAESTTDGAEFSTAIRKFKEVRKNAGFYEYLTKEGGKRTGDELDVSVYFEIFPRLSIEQGYTLDWVYSGSELGGGPLLYARKTDAKPFRRESELVGSVREKANLDAVEAIYREYSEKYLRLVEEEKKEGRPAEPNPDPFASPQSDEFEKKRKALMDERDALLEKYPQREYWEWWRDAIITDGTDQGFLELGALYLLASQFSLYWHMLTNDLVILPDRLAVEELITHPVIDFKKDDDELLPSDVIQKARHLDPTPTVSHDKEKGTVTVTYLTFTKWGGFQRTSVTVREQAPHKLITTESRDEVEWNCYIIF